MQNLSVIFAFLTANGGRHKYHPSVGRDNRRQHFGVEKQWP